MRADLSTLRCVTYLDGGGLYERDACAHCSRPPVSHHRLVVEDWSAAGPFQYAPPHTVSASGLLIEKTIESRTGQKDGNWFVLEAEIRGRHTDWGTYPTGEMP